MNNENKCTKYNRTYHVPWSKCVAADDKIQKDLSRFKKKGVTVVITEKLDGECTTMYSRYDASGIHARSLTSPMNWTREWVRSVQVAIAHKIKGLRLCGENMAATHSITYDNLIGFFYLFSVWDEETNMCYSWDDTVALANELDLPTPKVLYRGEWDEDKFKELFDEMDTEKMEGYTIRLADSFHYDEFRYCLVKAVRANHVQTDVHWLKSAEKAVLADTNNVKPLFMKK